MGRLWTSWALLFFAFLFARAEVKGQYSEATQKVLDAPYFLVFLNPTEGLSKEQIWSAVEETTGRDGFQTRFLKGCFRNSIGSDSVDIYFSEAKSHGERIGLGYDTLGLIDYVIAETNLYAGKIRIAELYLNKIIRGTSELDYIYWLAKIKRARIFPNKAEVEELKKAVSSGFSSELNSKLVAYLTLQLTTVVLNQDRLAYYRKYRRRIANSNDPTIIFLYNYGCVSYVRSYSDDKNELTKNINTVKKSYDDLKKKSKYFDARYQRLLSEEYASKGMYYKASEAAAMACYKSGLDTASRFDIKDIDLSSIHAIDFFSNFALSKLYLGPKGVEDAFEIYYRLAEQYLINQALHLTGWDIAGRYSLEKKTLIPKVLYIANYIYTETGDRSYLNRALAMVDASRGATLYSQLFRREAIKDGGGLSELLKRDLELSREEYRLSQEDDDGTLLDRMITTQQKRQRVMADIAAEYPDYLEQRSMVSSDFIGEQQERLAQSGGSMLYFLHHGNFSFRILINSDSVQIDNLYHRVLDKNELPELMVAYPDCVNQSPGIDGNFSAECQANGYALYQRLIGGIEDQLQEKVLIIGDGPFTNFPFSSLPADEAGTEYLGTRNRITYNVSARLQRMMEDQQVNPKYHELLAFSPATGNSTFASDRGSEKLTFLKNTGAELDAIEAIIPGSYYRDQAATRENLLKKIADYEVVHLASHASADPNDGRLSYLVLNQEADEFSTPLYAVELAEQELNAELIVLSACETGSGSDHLSEGTLGLTHAFTAAGARSVISSRWSVDDAATAELMGYFYTHTHAGLEKDESLRLAQQDYRIQHAGTYRDHPYYWSAFVLSGDVGPVTLQSAAGALPVKLLLAGAIIALVGGFVWRSKRVA